MNEQELQRAIREVIKLASVDPDFRAKAVSNPNGALSSVGAKGTWASIRFVDDFGTGGRTIVLPDPVANVDQLTEADLEQVAGGCFITTCAEVSCNNTGDPVEGT
jgi:hypothetical protein